MNFYIKDEILLKGEEVLARKYALIVAHGFLATLKEVPNVHFTKIYYRWKSLPDENDNKFVDCAIAANADYLITNDTNYNILKQVNFPKVSIITIQEFEKLAMH